ncbi:hypothetical protein [Xanthobacter sediminis]
MGRANGDLGHRALEDEHVTAANSAPLKLWINGSCVILRSLDDAVDIVRAHPAGEHAGPLIDQMEAADRPDLERRAWTAFTTFTVAMQPRCGNGARLSL